MSSQDNRWRDQQEALHSLRDELSGMASFEEKMRDLFAEAERVHEKNGGDRSVTEASND